MTTLPRNPVARLVIGRAVTNLAAFAYCLLRAMTYFVPSGDRPRSTAAQILSGGGDYLWVWGVLWLGAGIWCLVDLYHGHTRRGIAAAVGLAMMWGTAHLLVWAASGFTNPDWAPGLGFVTPSLIIFGLLLKVTALRDMVEAARDGGDSNTPPEDPQ